MQLSVIICCHNPRIDYLARVLEALKAQTLSTDNWELLVVDNASEGSVAASYNISWHPNARHVREENLGLTCARMRGIAEASADLLVFVDDDNVLAENYLDVVTQIATDWRCLGAWGGQQLAENRERFGNVTSGPRGSCGTSGRTTMIDEPRQSVRAFVSGAQ